MISKDTEALLRSMTGTHAVQRIADEPETTLMALRALVRALSLSLGMTRQVNDYHGDALEHVARYGSYPDEPEKEKLLRISSDVESVSDEIYNALVRLMAKR